MESKLNQRLKMAKMKERMRAKAEANANKEKQTMGEKDKKPLLSEEELVKLFSSAEKNEKTLRNNKKRKINKLYNVICKN